MQADWGLLETGEIGLRRSRWKYVDHRFRRRSRRDGPGADQFHLVLEEYLAAGLGGIFVWCGGIYSPEFDIIISV